MSGVEQDQPGAAGLSELRSALECDKCIDICGTHDNLEQHISDYTDVSSPLPQVDGNASIQSISSEPTANNEVVTNTDPRNSRNDIIMTDQSNPAPSSSRQDFRYNYSLNPQNQTKRLVANASKPPISVIYNNPKIVEGVQYNLNAVIECNSGVYITAIKPVLESVSVGWTSDLGMWTISCSKLSNRQDNSSDHLLCTQLTLLIKANNCSAKAHQLTLHFYHTQDKILIQGSSIISAGVSAATWLVKNFIEPLTTIHITNNPEAINIINDAIMTSVSTRSWSCHFCHTNIDPGATQVRDHPLSCGTCNQMFHKRCTDRRATGRNWNRDPWYCSACITSNSTPTVATQPGAALSAESVRPSILLEDTSILSMNAASLHLNESLNPLAQDFHPHSSPAPAPLALPPRALPPVAAVGPAATHVPPTVVTARPHTGGRQLFRPQHLPSQIQQFCRDSPTIQPDRDYPMWQLVILKKNLIKPHLIHAEAQ